MHQNWQCPSTQQYQCLNHRWWSCPLIYPLKWDNEILWDWDRLSKRPVFWDNSSSAASKSWSWCIDETRTWNCFLRMSSFSSSLPSLSSSSFCSIWSCSILFWLVSLSGWVMITWTLRELDTLFWHSAAHLGQSIVLHPILTNSLGLQ